MITRTKKNKKRQKRRQKEMFPVSSSSPLYLIGSYAQWQTDVEIKLVRVFAEQKPTRWPLIEKEKEVSYYIVCCCLIYFSIILYMQKKNKEESLMTRSHNYFAVNCDCYCYVFSSRSMYFNFLKLICTTICIHVKR